MTTFPFEFERRYAVAARLFGVTPARTSIVVDDSRLTVRFGPWHVETPLANITGVSITGPYAYVKTAGPAHLSFSDRGLTFATNSRSGVCIELAQPIPGIDPAGLLRHPNSTLTPADPAGLAAALRRDLGA